MKNIKLLLIFAIIAAMFCTVFSGCGTSEKSAEQYARFEMENGGVFYIELYPQYAPDTVENFKKLVSEGFYDGIIFHRVETGMLIQGGDPDGDGYGGSDTKINGEFPSNGFSKNTLKHTPGVISMARTSDPNSATSQFFICVSSLPSLDGDYAAFGKVISGMDVIKEIGNCDVRGSTPVIPQRIKSATLVSKDEPFDTNIKEK